MTRRFAYHVSLPFLLLFTWAACGSDTVSVVPSGSKVEAVILVPRRMALSVGDTASFQITAVDGTGAVVPFRTARLASDDTTVASVDSQGLVTARAEGVASVSAMVEGVVESLQVTVTSEDRKVFFTEDFEDPNPAARGWFDNTTFTISGTEYVSGVSSLEWRWGVGDVLPSFGATARILFPESESVHLSFWIKYSANWQGSGQPYHPHEFYLLTNVDGQWIGPAETQLTLYVEHNYANGGLRPAVGIQDALNIDQDQIGVDLTGITEARAVAGCNGSTDGYPDDCYDTGNGFRRNSKFWRTDPYLGDARGPTYKNAWHFVEAYFKLNTIVGGEGVPDGVVRYWIDGQLLIDLSDVLLRTGAHPDMAIRELLLGPYIGPGSPVDQAVWIDDIQVADQR